MHVGCSAAQTVLWLWVLGLTVGRGYSQGCTLGLEENLDVIRPTLRIQRYNQRICHSLSPASSKIQRLQSQRLSYQFLHRYVIYLFQSLGAGLFNPLIQYCLYRHPTSDQQSNNIPNCEWLHSLCPAKPLDEYLS